MEQPNILYLAWCGDVFTKTPQNKVHNFYHDDCFLQILYSA